MHEVPESMIHLCLMFSSRVSDSSLVSPIRARAVNRQTTGYVVERGIVVFIVVVMGFSGIVTLVVGTFTFLGRAKALNKWTTGWVVGRATATFADVVVESLDMVVLELGELDPCSLALPSASCSFFNFQHSLTSWPHMSQWVQCFFAFSLSFSFLLSFIFLEALVKKAVAPTPDSQMRRCSSAKICALSSFGKIPSLEFASTVFRGPRELGSADMSAATMMSCLSFEPRFRTARADLRSEFI